MSCRFAAPQAWFGTTVTFSPSSGRAALAERSTIGVLLGERAHRRVGVLDDEPEEPVVAAERRVGGERLRAGVEDGAVGRRPAHDRRDRAQRTVVEVVRAADEAAPVAVDVVPDPQLRYLGVLVGVERARACRRR